MNSKIISIILGVVLLSSVASFLPTPVYGFVACGAGLIETRDDYNNYDGDIYPFESSSGNYNFVMPIVGLGGDEYQSGTVKFSYQVEAGDEVHTVLGEIIMPEKDIGMREIVIDPEWGKYGLVNTPQFAYGFELTRPAGEDYVTVILFCDYSEGREMWIEPVNVEHLPFGSEIYTSPKDSDGDGYPNATDECPLKSEDFLGDLTDGCPEESGTTSDDSTSDDDSMSLYERGKDLYKSGSYEDAIEYFDQALELDADNVKVLEDKSDALRKLQRYERLL